MYVLTIANAGSVSQEEFDAWWDEFDPSWSCAKNLTCTPEEKVRLQWAAKAFRKADTDASGKIDRVEFTQLYHELRNEGGMLSEQNLGRTVDDGTPANDAMHATPMYASADKLQVHVVTTTAAPCECVDIR